jgi:hypothetical protein
LNHQGAFKESMLFLLKAEILWDRTLSPESFHTIMNNRTVDHNERSANLSERHLNSSVFMHT